MRNESLILEDTLSHFFKHCDHIYIYDDCSTDNSVEIMKSFDDVTVIEGKEWSPNQWHEESKHRGQLLDLVDADMCLCFDADERLGGDLPSQKGGFTLDLYDGYLTPDRQEPYTKGDLSRLPRLWGTECRQILMYFDPKKARYDRSGQREPTYTGNVQKSGIKVKHYGKCLSIDHWDDTCDFYATYFPQWRDKWNARKGKAIHTKSDFGSELHTWSELCKKY